MNFNVFWFCSQNTSYSGSYLITWSTCRSPDSRFCYFSRYFVKIRYIRYFTFTIGFFLWYFIWFNFFYLVLSLIGFTYASMVALSQIDIKKIIAYSSIAHMNFSLFGMFSFSIVGLAGMFYLMLGHAITSGALFLGIGVLYDRYKTRLIFYYGSLVIFMPVFSILYFIFILSNFGFPGTSNFVGEFLILAGGFDFSNIIIFLSTFGMILSLIYSLFLYNRLFFGVLQETFLRYYADCSRLEFTILIVFSFLVIIGGLYPKIIFFFCINNLVSNNILILGSLVMITDSLNLLHRGGVEILRWKKNFSNTCLLIQ